MNKRLLLKLTVLESRAQTWGDRSAGGGRGSTGLTQRTLPSPGAATLPGRVTGGPTAVLTAESDTEGESTLWKGRVGDKQHTCRCWKTTRQHIQTSQREAQRYSRDLAKDSFVTGWLCQMQTGQLLGPLPPASAPVLGPSCPHCPSGVLPGLSLNAGTSRPRHE